MKTVYLLTQNERLRKRWKSLLEKQYETKTVAMLEELAGQGSECYVVYHDDADKSGMVEHLERIKPGSAGLNIMILRSLPDIAEGRELLAYDIKGYGNANMSDSVFTQAVDVLTEGNIWLYPPLMNHIVKSLNIKSGNKEALKNLSVREKEIVQEVAEGLNNGMIAAKLNIAESTVKTHLASAFSKLGVKNRVALALLLNR